MTKGYLLTFFTQQSRERDGISLADWIIEEAKRIGVRGATLYCGQEGFGHDGRFHSDSYFELEDPPLLVTMALEPDECDRLLLHLKTAQVRVFYAKSEASFGLTS